MKTLDLDLNLNLDLDLNLNLKTLTNEELERQAKCAVKEETRCTLQVLTYIKEIYERRLHLEKGLSLREYAQVVFGYSKGAAYRRTSAMELLENIPESRDALIRGELNLTVASQIQTVIKNNKNVPKQKIYDELKNKSDGEIRAIYQPESPKLPVDQAFLEKLEAIKRLTPHQNELKLLHRMADELLEKLQKPVKEPTVNPNTRYIKKATKELVWREAQGQCEYRSKQTGHRCSAKTFLQADHINPYAMGGVGSVPNLRLLCRAHNLFAAIKVYGEKKMQQNIERAET